MKNKFGKAIFKIADKYSFENIKPVKIESSIDSSNCEMIVQVGMFFDGTGNNIFSDKRKNAHSNIARIFETYPNDPKAGKYSVYIPGLGTSFPEIGEESPNKWGAAFAEGGDSRIIFALLRFLGIIHKNSLNSEMFDPVTSRALCSLKPSSFDKERLKKLGLNTSLANGEVRENVKRYLKICVENIRHRLKSKGLPKIKQIYVDIFGFSRGATEARVFCHWLNDILIDNKLAEMPVVIRFLGIMDTVASVGMFEGIKNDQLRRTGGHSNWATPDVLRIHSKIINCIHFIAMHELRKNFPLDTVLIDGEMPPNCIEYAYPGSHSDIGGGYQPGELGVSPDDSLKLSQIPLNHMYECALAAGVPLSKKILGSTAKSTFLIHEDLISGFKKFIAAMNNEPRQLDEWMLPYLAWRWQIRKKYESISQVKNSSLEDKKHLTDGNLQFYFGDEIIRSYVANEKMKTVKKKNFNREGNVDTLLSLEKEAPDLRARIMQQNEISPDLAKFFDDFVHDSMAGFRKQFVETTGHWRYRRFFQGCNKDHAN